MAYEGYVDYVDARTVSGWVYDNGQADAPLWVEVLVGGRVMDTILADRPRHDLAAEGKGNGRHAFHYDAAEPFAGPVTVRLPGRRWTLPAGGPIPVPGRFRSQLAHSLEFGLPMGEATFTEPSPSADEPAMAERLIAAHRRAMADDPANHRRRAEDIWSTLTALCHQELADLLKRRDVAGLSAYLRDAHAMGITQGITQGNVTTPLLRARPEARRLEHARFVDNLVSLAESMGLLDVESPEQHGRWAENLHVDPDDLIDRIGAAAGVPVVPPPVCGSMLGIGTAAGVVSGRDLLALYASLRIRAVSPVAKPVVCEIGGGLGGVGYYLAKAGAVRRHTIVDLPLVNVLQGYYLMRSLPGVAVRLYGERPDPAAVVEVMPTFAFAADPTPIDVLFNMDSMPEMHPDYATGYLRDARRRSAKLFLSINQEARALRTPTDAQSVVHELAGAVGGYRRQYRFRHWLKAGYVEELYAIDPASGAERM